MLELALDVGSGQVCDNSDSCCCISTYFNVLPWPLLQFSMLVKTKLIHTDKGENGDMLVHVGNIAVEY